MEFERAVTIYEDEDETALKADFVRLMAKYKSTRSPYEIAKYIFGKLREPELRAGQVASLWATDLEILEQIDETIVRGSGGKLDTKQDRLAALEQIYKDTAALNKDKIEAIKLSALIEGEIVKQTENKNVNDNTPALKQFMFAKYED